MSADVPRIRLPLALTVHLGSQGHGHKQFGVRTKSAGLKGLTHRARPFRLTYPTARTPPQVPFIRNRN